MMLIKNGRVIDPAAGVDAVTNVYVKNNRIADAPADSADEPETGATVIDASGCLVLPGLIDFHTHLGYQLSDFGLNPDLYTLPNGITSAVDAGSGGTQPKETDFRRKIEDSGIVGGKILLPELGGVSTVGVAVGIQFGDDVDHPGVAVEAEVSGVLVVDRSDVRSFT